MVDTVKTVKPSGGDYTSLSAWEAGQQKIIASGDSEQAECYSMADTTAVTINGWTTASDAYIRIYTPTSERHDGKWNTSKYRLEAATNVLVITEEHVRVEGLQIRYTSTTAAGIGVNINAAGAWDVRLDNCLIRAMDAIANNCNGVLSTTGAAGSVLRMKNCAVYGWYSAGNFDAPVQINNANITAHLHNCTFARGNYGVRARAGTVNCKNCYSGATDYGDYYQEGTGVMNLTTCASEDTTGSAGLQNIAYSTTAGAYFTNITAGSEDFHIGASSALVDAGTDLSADANYAFTDDIDGQTRSGSWDIGVDEIVAVAAGFAPFPDDPIPAAFRSARSFFVPPQDVFLSAWAAGGTIILVSDAGTGADALAIAVGLAIADSGVGNDAAPAPAASVPVGDAGAGTDAISLGVRVSIVDAASGVDAVSVLMALLKTVTDAGAGSDAISIAAQTAVTDAGAGADQPSLAISLVVADSAAAVDVVSVLMATLKTVVDGGTGVDTVSVAVSVPVGDAGSGLDAVAIAALLSVIDAGAGVDIAVRFDAAVRIATITFTLAERSISFSLARRSISFLLH